jgi:hypothetical protein
MEMNVYGITTLAGASGPATGERIYLMPRLARSVENVPHSRIRELAEIAMSMD